MQIFLGEILPNAVEAAENVSKNERETIDKDEASAYTLRDVDMFICTSPFFLCLTISKYLEMTQGAAVTAVEKMGQKEELTKEGLPKIRPVLINYLGLPTLWKGPADFDEGYE